MSLAKRATTPPVVGKQGMPCPIATLLDTLPKSEAKGLQDMLDSPWRVWPHTDVEKAIEDEGHRIGIGSVGKHRRLTCRCGKPQGVKA